MARLTRKLWVGIGCVVITGAQCGSAAAQASHGGAEPPAAAGGASASHAPDDGGEAYLTDGGPTDTRIRFYRDIELIRGHLLIGQQLIAHDLWEEATPHFLHPTEELYERMRRHIAMHDIRPFRRELLALAQAVKAKRRAAYEQALAVVDQRLGAAFAVAKRFMNPLAAFTVRTAVEVLKAALSEYQSSLLEGEFVRPVEYQDGRGFVWRASSMIEENATELARIDNAALEKMRSTLAKLKTAWPSVMPPAAPALQPGKIAAFIADIELYASRYR
jgi:hypothetical protein